MTLIENKFSCTCALCCLSVHVAIVPCTVSHKETIFDFPGKQVPFAPRVIECFFIYKRPLLPLDM